MARFKPPGQCPVCGEWVPRGAVACDDCGSCAKSGWKDDADVYDGVDLPEPPEDFDYDRFVEEKFGTKRSGVSRELLWRWVAAAVLAAMVLGYFFSR